MANPEFTLNPQYPTDLGDGRDQIHNPDGSIANLLSDALVTVQTNKALREGHSNHDLMQPISEEVFNAKYAEIREQGPQTPGIEKTVGGSVPDWVTESTRPVTSTPVYVRTTAPSSPVQERTQVKP